MAIQSKFRWCLVLMFFGCLGCSDNSEASYSSKNKTESPKELFLLHCAACHGEKGDLGVSGAKNLRTSSLRSVEIRKIIYEGKNGMPSFKGILTEKQQVDSLVNYVMTLRD